ncbi:MAG: 2-polyprenyl-3-methyl-6-methoxy-1,4-benzoquinone monooxygenase [Casimicrobiaceae bacterium]|nr:2-polyprenyl-3-methyl-6-methoxy-1,4-benzoquinone monooxygenase [Casimicrobiaceae bacterium]
MLASVKSSARENGSGTLGDRLIGAFDTGLRCVTGVAAAARPSPAQKVPEAVLDERERRCSIALMRVNHAGEVAAQALYQGQALFARSEATRAALKRAGREELDHLVWTRERVEALGGRTSLLDPLWYAGAFALGAAAAALGDGASLAFLKETEEQVEAHLKRHLERLPAADTPSRAIVEQMKIDEAQHARTAERLGAQPVPWFVRVAMRASATVMTTLAARI